MFVSGEREEDVFILSERKKKITFLSTRQMRFRNYPLTLHKKNLLCDNNFLTLSSPLCCDGSGPALNPSFNW